MAKRREHIITANDLCEYLSTRDDFALELFVYQKAREFDFSATHGGTYIDPVTNKPRQFDVRAAFERENCRVALAIECKNLQPTYPLLLSRIPRAPAESFHQLIFYGAETVANAPFLFGQQSLIPGQMKKPIAPRPKAVSVLGNRSIYQPNGFVGKSTTQVGRDDKRNLTSGDDGVYDKWSQALASADELVSLAQNGHGTNRLLTFVIPVLVVSDGTLWVADYSEDGRVINEPKQADESDLFVGRVYGGSMRISYTISHLHILTKKRVGSFFDRLKDTEYWQQIFHLARDI